MVGSSYLTMHSIIEVFSTLSYRRNKAATGSGLEVGYRLPVAGWAENVSPGGWFSQISAGKVSMLHLLHILSGNRVNRAIWNISFGHLHLLLLALNPTWLNPAGQRL
jgi:hypothetical protein